MKVKYGEMIAAVSIFAWSTVAFAQQPLTSDEVMALVTGKSLAIGDTGVATYGAGSNYDFATKQGGNFRGKWKVQGDSVCVTFDTGRSRCDQFLKEANTVYLKNASGTKYQVTVK